MTNIIKRKNLLFLMAVVVMVAMMSVACKNKATQPASFSVDGDVVVDNPIEEPTIPEKPATPEEPGGGEKTDETYDVDVIYPEINDTLISELDKTWKNFVNDGNKKLYVTTASATTAANVKTYNHTYFTFDADGNMVFGYMNHVNPADRGKVIKTFVKAVIVKVNGGYVVGGLYKVNDFKLESIRDLKAAVVDRKVTLSLNGGNYEIVYVNPANSYKGGYEYSIIGSYSSTKDLDVSNFVKPEDYSDKLPNKIGGLNPQSYNYTRVYRVN